MDTTEFYRLTDAHSHFIGVLDKAEHELDRIADDYQNRFRNAYLEVFANDIDPHRRYNLEYRWMFVADAVINFSPDNPGVIMMEFWESGSGFNQDERLEQFPLSIDLLTEEGRQAAADEWKSAQAGKIDKSIQEIAELNRRKIKKLEDELEQLKKSIEGI